MDPLRRYSRQLPLLGPRAQERLAGSKVVVAGLGGLGSFVALELAALGVGSLVLVDHDTVSESNLNRQVLYSQADLGLPKVYAAARRLRELRPDLAVSTHHTRITTDNAGTLIRGADVVVDALDNWASRLALADAAWEAGIPLVHGAIDGFYGQVTTVEPGKSICLHCIAPGPAPPRRPPAIVTTAAIVASHEVSEVLKLLTGAGEPLYNKLLFIDTREPRIDQITLHRTPCENCKRLTPMKDGSQS
ncbi:MAG: HesA/MoeB/ThiF family protein [Desulfurococcales archaeon]|nr:HesA/MoeB/ThiF family protein [Desulfurococcales archaeon]